jgi:hypothetical protein
MERYNACTLFRNISANRYAFDVKLLTIASVLQLKIQEEMPVIMKIDGYSI